MNELATVSKFPQRYHDGGEWEYKLHQLNSLNGAMGLLFHDPIEGIGDGLSFRREYEFLPKPKSVQIEIDNLYRKEDWRKSWELADQYRRLLPIDREQLQRVVRMAKVIDFVMLRNAIIQASTPATPEEIGKFVFMIAECQEFQPSSVFTTVLAERISARSPSRPVLDRVFDYLVDRVERLSIPVVIRAIETEQNRYYNAASICDEISPRLDRIKAYLLETDLPPPPLEILPPPAQPMAIIQPRVREVEVVAVEQEPPPYRRCRLTSI